MRGVCRTFWRLWRKIWVSPKSCFSKKTRSSAMLWRYSILWLWSSAERRFEGGHLLSSSAFNQIIIQSGSIYAQQLCPQFVYNWNWSWNEKFIKHRMHLWEACVCVCVRRCRVYLCVYEAFKVHKESFKAACTVCVLECGNSQYCHCISMHWNMCVRYCLLEWQSL